MIYNMNQELYNHLYNEPLVELFYNFKHDGLLNFEKKIISGKILHEKKFNRTSLRKEKNLIVNEIESLISEYSNSSNLENKKKKEALKSIFFTFLGAITSVVFLLMTDNQSFKNPNWIFFITIGFNILLVLISIIRYNRDVRKLIQMDLDDLEIQQKKLEIIHKEWKF